MIRSSRVATESTLLRQIRAAVAAEPGVLLWRNSVGFDAERRITYGLGVGSPDLVGLVDGTFLGLEVKTAEGRVSREQVLWREAVRARGGVVEVVRSVDEALEVVRGCRR